MTADLDNRRKKLLFRAGHRGTKEMDLILGSFARDNLGSFDESETDAFEEILQYSDPDLYNWITGKEPVPANLRTPVLDKLLAHRVQVF